MGVTGSTPEGGGITGDYRDILNRNADYTVQALHRLHDFRGHGTFQLPFGPGRWLGGNTSGLVARLIEGWQFGTIFSMASGAPLNIVATNTIYANGTPDVVGALPREGKVNWNGVFGKKIYGNVEDVELEPATTSAAKLRETVADAVSNSK